MKTWLVQRASFRENDLKKGIDKILKFDYMGSTEFEWGALPESLKRIRSQIDNYTYTLVELNGKKIMTFYPKNLSKEMPLYLHDLAHGKMRTKEGTYFDDYIKGNAYREFDFWWDIENDIMFWKDSIEFKKKFKEVIK